jgi:pimeloyl-ACP methyl ester carboxylesterase
MLRGLTTGFCLLCTALPAAGATLGPFDERCRLTAESTPAAFGSCATLEVPENPDAPEGRTVELFLARIPPLTATPQPDPLLIITGGPGQSTVDFYLQTRGAFEPVRREREIILLDQRGTGRSAEGFACDVPEDLSFETAVAEAIGEFADECLANLERDPRFYTTSVAVRDLEALREALGIEQWNVYGVSYGTRVAQHYVRRYPERVRALVLDGVVPAPVALGPDVARHAQAALDRIFARCGADAACAQRFPDLAGRFDALLTRLEAEPLAAAAVPGAPREEPDAAPAEDRNALTADHLRAVARFMSYTSPTAALLPVTFSEAHGGNYAPLIGQATTLLRGLPEALSFPMSNSVVCTEDVPFIADGWEAGLEDTYLGAAFVAGLQATCARWPRGTMDSDFKAPLATDRPTLLLSGDNDPITPPAYATAVIAGGVANSVHVVGRDQGHGMVGVGCVPRLLRAFIETPVPAELDAACLQIEPPMPFFLSPFGPAP